MFSLLSRPLSLSPCLYFGEPSKPPTLPRRTLPPTYMCVCVHVHVHAHVMQHLSLSAEGAFAKSGPGASRHPSRLVGPGGLRNQYFKVLHLHPWPTENWMGSIRCT